MNKAQGTLEKVTGGNFFDQLPGKDEVVFERKRTSPHAERIKRIMAVLPEGIACTLIDGNTPGTLGQQGHMEGLGWRVVPRSEIKSLGIEEWVPTNQILLVIQEEVKRAHEDADRRRAIQSAQNAAEFDSQQSDVRTTSKIVPQGPVSVTGPVKASP